MSGGLCGLTNKLSATGGTRTLEWRADLDNRVLEVEDDLQVDAQDVVCAARIWRKRRERDDNCFSKRH